MCNWKKALDRSLSWVDDHTREEASDCGGGSTAGNPARTVSALKSVVETTSSSSNGPSHSSTSGTTTEHITAVVHTGVSAINGPSSSLLGADACPAMNVSVVHKAVGYVALAFCVGIAAGAGFVVGIDLIRSVKSGK
jgi:hypothetical protein